MNRIRAFTLVELLIASAIFLVIMLTVYSSFHTGMLGYRNIEEAIDVSQSTRQILERINLDLRNAVIYSAREAKFAGNKGSIEFLTIADRFTQDEILKEYCLVSYSLEGARLMRLCRRNQESLNQESRVSPEEMAYNLEEIAFSYGYINVMDNSLAWKDSWAVQDAPEDEQKSLPVAVKVELRLKSRIKQDFQRTIFLPLDKID